jgi:uncharacterized membrane protein
MQLFRLAFRRETIAPVLAVVLASGVSVALVVARMLWTGRPSYGFLLWNLFLAWLPLVLALAACIEYRGDARRNWRFFLLSGAWLLFFPNAPYIFTDVIHLTTHYRGYFWTDLVLILMCALTGLMLGFLSLFLMQGLVRRMMGNTVSWLFIAGVAALSGFGIYLGRFLRFNSWDVIWKPAALFDGIVKWVANPLAQSTSFAFPALFAVFLFLAYLMLYALTHLQPASLAAIPSQAERVDR